MASTQPWSAGPFPRRARSAGRGPFLPVVRSVGVDQPTWRDAIRTRADYELFQDSLAGRDFFLYATIRSRLDGLRKKEEAFSLTNT